jgi:hypothetical protein
VSYSWVAKRQSDNWSGTRNVNSIALVGGLWRITLASNETNVALGKLFEIRSSTTTANNGCWTVIAIHTGTSVFSVAETLVAQGISGNGVAASNGTLKVPATAVTSFVDVQTIQATGALFVTRNVRKGDRLAIYAGALNRASYYVLAVIDENNVQVVSRSLGANPLALGGLTGETLVVYNGYGDVVATNETAISWATVRTAFPYLVETSSLQAMTLHRIAAVRSIEMAQTGAAGSEFVSEDEVVLHHRTDATPISFITRNVGGSALQSTVRIGRAGSDNYSFSHGSFWLSGPSISNSDLATGSTTLLRLRAFGSLLANATSTAIGFAGQVSGCLLVSYPASSYNLFASMRQVLYSAGSLGAPVITVADTVVEDFFDGSAGTFGFLSGGSPIISDFRIAADAYQPPWRILSVPMAVFRDPKEDYLLTQVVSYADANSLARIEYTWLPRFVQLDPTGLTPVPVAGLTVHAYEFFEGIGLEGEIAGSPWVTDAQGRINAGLPIYLKARGNIFFGSRLTFEYAARFTVEGAGYRFINQIVKMHSPLDYDVRVQRMETDFEGEVST